MKERKIVSKWCRKPQERYCGENLECIGVQKGDTFSESLVKINTVFCEQECCEKLIEGVYWSNGDTTTGEGDGWKSLKQMDNSTPTYIVKESGKYRITLNTNTQVEDTSLQVLYGIGVNGSIPSFGMNENNSNATSFVVSNSGGSTPTSVDFIVELIKDDLVDIWVKALFGVLNIDTYHKLIFQKL